MRPFCGRRHGCASSGAGRPWSTFSAIPKDVSFILVRRLSTPGPHPETGGAGMLPITNDVVASGRFHRSSGSRHGSAALIHVG